MSTRRNFATIAVRQGLGSDQQHGAVVSPIHLSSTYQFEGLGAKRQQSAFGAMVRFELNCEEVDLAQFVESLELFFLAESLGGVESLIAHPASMTHAAMTPEARGIAGITEDLIRISVGLEHDQDLVDDLKQALDAATHAKHVTCESLGDLVKSAVC